MSSTRREQWISSKGCATAAFMFGPSKSGTTVQPAPNALPNGERKRTAAYPSISIKSGPSGIAGIAVGQEG